MKLNFSILEGIAAIAGASALCSVVFHKDPHDLPVYTIIWYLDIFTPRRQAGQRGQGADAHASFEVVAQAQTMPNLMRHHLLQTRTKELIRILPNNLNKARWQLVTTGNRW